MGQTRRNFRHARHLGLAALVFFPVSAMAATPTTGPQLAAQSAAAAIAPIPNEFDYPELNVTPRASDRVAQEAARENQGRWGRHMPILFSGAMTAAAGLVQFSAVDKERDSESRSPIAGVAVGGAWVGLVALLNSYSPYGNAQRELTTMPGKSMREQLSRERYAEREIQSAAALGNKLRWFSVVTNAATNIFLLSRVERGGAAQLIDAAALVSAFGPVFFRGHWQDVAEQQSDYKKRIYAPVAGTGFLGEPVTGSPSPAFFLSFFF